ncbi:GMC family oxidoreductase [Occallatibacter riparius]|uniref:GMC family oxidoreductase n=1 Tax=Occallatibacter riparius TaxID=1002689 RepID=A0A9J7BP54_9BACT|nr:GMC family oxidoreductase [Occallatibacter riparius]UWZ82702.1 GMC family oxidoreductase [Occallatibacter riparius]
MKRVNAVIVGAGAAGGIVAKELATAGLSVVLCERGPWYTAHDCRKDDLRNQRVTALGNAFGPDDDGNPRVIVDSKGIPREVLPSDGSYNNNAACVGGGTLSYGAQAWRFMPQDFRMRSTYGAPAGSSLEDWPISYDDLEPFYDKAEHEIGVSGDVSTDPFHGPRKRDLPMPPLPPNKEMDILWPAAKRLGLHPFNVPMLRNSVPYNGRGPCMRCRWCCGYACEVDAKNGSQNTVIPMALATGNCELRTECMVREILTDSHGRAAGVSYIDSRGNSREQYADIVIVSSAAIESARLLLNSKSRLFPNGLGNRYDQVGRNLQGHHYTGATGYFDYEVYDDLGPGVSVAVCDYNHGTPGLSGGGMLANEFTRLPYQMTDRLPPGTPSWGLAHKQAMRQWHKRAIIIMGPTQQIPSPSARVTLDPKVRDKYGMPVARLEGNVHPHTFEIGDRQSERAVAWLKEGGAIHVSPMNWHPDTVSAGQHQAGTCRMGTDPHASVVNKNCQLHDVDNVFVIDGSVHVTNGGFNPVLTIMAVAYYASDALVRNWKGTRFRS